MNFEKLDGLVGLPESGWFEYNLEVVAEEIDNLDAKNFGSLYKHITSKPEYWRIRCAESLGESGNDRSLSILAKLLLTDDCLEVKISSACSLEDSNYVLDTGFRKCLQHLLTQMNANCDTRYEDVERLLSRTGL